MKKVYVLLSYPHLLIGFAIVVIVMLSVSQIVYVQNQNKGTNQDQDKILELGNGFTPAVDITFVKSHIGIIEPNKNFSASEDWYKRLEVTVRNNSEKPITSISVSVRFPRLDGQGKRDFVVPLDYGESPIPSKDGKFPTNSVKPLMPNESVELKLSDNDFDIIKAFLKELEYPISIKKIKIYVTMVGFDDDTQWIANKLYKIDRSNPGKLIPLNQKKKN